MSREGGTTPMHGNSSWTEHRGHTLHWAGRPSSRVGRPSLTPDSGPPKNGEPVRIVGFLALVWALTFAGLLILFSWVTAELPSTAQATCPRVENCVPPSLIEDPDLGIPTAHYPEPTEAP